MCEGEGVEVADGLRRQGQGRVSALLFRGGLRRGGQMKRLACLAATAVVAGCSVKRSGSSAGWAGNVVCESAIQR